MVQKTVKRSEISEKKKSTKRRESTTGSFGKVTKPQLKKKSARHVKKAETSKRRKSAIVAESDPNTQKVSEDEEEIDGEIEELAEKFKISQDTVKKGVQGIIKFTSENPKLKDTLFREQFPLFLQVNCIKMATGHSSILRFPLKNSLLTPESEVCLIVADVKGIPNKEHKKHLEHYEELFRKKGVNNIKKVMTFHEFRTEYEAFEMKRRLVELYDTFLVDGKISGKVVRKCGKIFYKKRKVPTAVKLQATKLKEHIDKTLMKTQLHLHQKSDSFIVQFGHSQMPVPRLVENVFSVLKGLDEYFPGGFENLRSLYLHTFRGLTIPVYVTLKNKNLVPVPKIEENEIKRETVVGELTTYGNTEVMVKPSGQVFVRKMDKSKGTTESNEESVSFKAAKVQVEASGSKIVKQNKRSQKSKQKGKLASSKKPEKKKAKVAQS